MHKDETRHLSYTTYIESILSITQNGLKTWTITSRRKYGGKHLNISLGNDFLNLALKQNKQVELWYQTKKLLYSKGNHQQNEKAPYGM